jgi:hypothetical protein
MLAHIRRNPKTLPRKSRKRNDVNEYLFTLFLTACGQPEYCKTQPASLRSDACPHHRNPVPTSLEYAIARRYEDEGLDSALYEKPRPGKPPALDVNQSQRIIAMVCGPPPEGLARWSVRLIAEQAVKRKLVPAVGRETIRVLLQNHDLKPWREKNVVRGGTE